MNEKELAKKLLSQIGIKINPIEYCAGRFIIDKTGKPYFEVVFIKLTEASESKLFFYENNSWKLVGKFVGADGYSIPVLFDIA